MQKNFKKKIKIKKNPVKKQYKNGSSSDRLRATKLTCEVKKPKDFVSQKRKKFRVWELKEIKEKIKNLAGKEVSNEGGRYGS